ncbi:MAG: orotidine-5'-phosphate decarboxylase [Bacteroidales bacterium]|nr:orotidine-5'-phosphate decarboxylase [Bacteroidales bacterium]
MTRKELIELIRKKQSFLCVGLDTDMDRIPESLKQTADDPQFEFNRRIIDATIDFAVAYKPNTSFYESCGSKGWESLEKTVQYLKQHPAGPVFTIADAKRGDIGNTAQQYARAFFKHMDFDALTVNPYMGHDAVKPFLKYPGKWAIVLGLTSNPGAHDFQILQPQLPLLLEKMGIKTCYWKKLYELVIEQAMQWGTEDNMMFVVGATQAEMIDTLRDTVPNHFFLIPGVGAQGGSLSEIAEKAMNKDVGILVNSSRDIIFASGGSDFDLKARDAAKNLQKAMQELLRNRG